MSSADIVVELYCCTISVSPDVDDRCAVAKAWIWAGKGGPGEVISGLAIRWNGLTLAGELPVRVS